MWIAFVEMIPVDDFMCKRKEAVKIMCTGVTTKALTVKVFT